MDVRSEWWVSAKPSAGNRPVVDPVRTAKRSERGRVA